MLFYLNYKIHKTAPLYHHNESTEWTEQKTKVRCEVLLKKKHIYEKVNDERLLIN